MSTSTVAPPNVTGGHDLPTTRGLYLGQTDRTLSGKTDPQNAIKVGSNKAVGYFPQGGLRHINFFPLKLFEEEQTKTFVEQHQKNFNEKSKVAWTNQSNSLQKDDRVLAYYDFQRQGSGNSIPNLAPTRQDSILVANGPKGDGLGSRHSIFID